MPATTMAMPRAEATRACGSPPEFRNSNLFGCGSCRTLFWGCLRAYRESVARSQVGLPQDSASAPKPLHSLAQTIHHRRLRAEGILLRSVHVGIAQDGQVIPRRPEVVGIALADQTCGYVRFQFQSSGRSDC